MDTNAKVSDELYTHTAVKSAAADLANGQHTSHPHVLAQKLKELYQRTFGGTNLDALDWHWQATNLMNKLRATGKLRNHTAGTPAVGEAAGTKPANPGSAALTPTKTGTGEPIQPDAKVTKVPGSPSGDDLGNPIRDANQIGDPTVNFKHDSAINPGEPKTMNKDNAGTAGTTE